MVYITFGENGFGSFRIIVVAYVLIWVHAIHKYLSSMLNSSFMLLNGIRRVPLQVKSFFSLK